MARAAKSGVSNSANAKLCECKDELECDNQFDNNNNIDEHIDDFDKTINKIMLIYMILY
jgi:hypothetical protein